MGQKKKIKGEPSLLFKNKIISLSEASTWEEARKEWCFGNFYYVANDYVTCLCSPRGAKNIVLLVNRVTQSEILLCNSCVEIYFDIYDGGKIEESVRRLRKNIKLTMNLETLSYLDKNRMLNVREVENYEVALDCRSDNRVIQYRAGINQKLLTFTEYRKKEIFDRIDCLFAKLVEIGNNEESLHISRCVNSFLRAITTDFSRISELTRTYDVDNCNYNYEQRMQGRKSLNILSTLWDNMNYSDYFEKKIRSGQANVLPDCAEYEPGFDKEKYLAEKRKAATKTIINEVFEGAEDIYDPHYDDEDDYDDYDDENDLDDGVDTTQFTDNMQKKLRALLIKTMKKVTPEYTRLDLLEDIEGERYAIDMVTSNFKIEDCVTILLEDVSIRYTSLTIKRLYNRMSPTDGADLIKNINQIFSKAKMKLEVKGNDFRICNIKSRIR